MVWVQFGKTAQLEKTLLSYYIWHMDFHWKTKSEVMPRILTILTRSKWKSRNTKKRVILFSQTHQPSPVLFPMGWGCSSSDAEQVGTPSKAIFPYQGLNLQGPWGKHYTQSPTYSAASWNCILRQCTSFLQHTALNSEAQWKFCARLNGKWKKEKEWNCKWQSVKSLQSPSLTFLWHSSL